jgi:hypothetical protein
VNKSSVAPVVSHCHVIMPRDIPDDTVGDGVGDPSGDEVAGCANRSVQFYLSRELRSKTWNKPLRR